MELQRACHNQQLSGKRGNLMVVIKRIEMVNKLLSPRLLSQTLMVLLTLKCKNQLLMVEEPSLTINILKLEASPTDHVNS
mgnify:CR=1 FL=1